jgi:hypothetical protein
MVALQTELREAKAKLRQSVDQQAAFKKHVEAKEQARAAEVSGWDVKKDALESQHKVVLQQVQSEAEIKVSKLENELERVKHDLSMAQAQVSDLKQALKDSDGSVNARSNPSIETKSSYSAPVSSKPVAKESESVVKSRAEEPAVDTQRLADEKAKADALEQSRRQQQEDDARRAADEAAKAAAEAAEAALIAQQEAELAAEEAALSGASQQRSAEDEEAAKLAAEEAALAAEEAALQGN